jgi:hypothetical protein
MIKKILELKNAGKTDTEIGKELEITRQKVGALVKKHQFELESVSVEDEFPIEMFAKSSKVVKDMSMGGSVVLSADEYNEFSEANGRYQGRKEGVVTKLDPMELRVAITGIQRGDRSGADVRNHLMAKHGITEDAIRTAAMKLTREEEISYAEVCKQIGLRP